MLLEPPPARRRRLLPVVAGVLVLALVAGAVVVYLVFVRDTGPAHPDSWDPRVEELAQIVEDERDLDFEHPVYVDFLEEGAFAEQVTTDDEDLSDEDREEIEQFTGLFRAVGLVEGEVDLFASANELNEVGIVGYYSSEDERIRIRGTELTPAVRSTLVHELTHVLQDQRFDLDAKTEEVEDDATAAGALDALVEGDARRIETTWRTGLDEEEQQAVADSLAEQSSGYEEASKDIPEVLRTMMGAPYALGEALLAVAVQQGGDRAVDALFEQPPTTDEHQLDPWSLVEDHAVPLDVPDPELAEGEKSFDDGPFGSVMWLLVLAERIPLKEALTAADGWGGDAYVAFEREGASCVRIDYRGDTLQDLDEMGAALTTWVGRLPSSTANVRVSGSMLTFESCDPGTQAASVATESSQDAISLALSRTYLSVSLADSGFTPAQARCAADRLVRELTIKQLNDPDIDPQRVRGIIAPCLG